MAAYSAAQVVNKTLSTTTVDTVTLTGAAAEVQVLNRGTSTNTIWVKASATGTPSDPTAAGDDCFPVYAGERITVLRGAGPGAVVKIIGSSDPYSVIGTVRSA